MRPSTDEADALEARPRRRHPQRVLKAAIWLGRHELGFLVVLSIIGVVAWGTIELIDEVVEGSTRAVDRNVLLAMRKAADVSDPVGPTWFEEAVRDVTALGSIAILTFVALATAGYLALRRSTRALVFMLAAIGGGGLLSRVLKHMFDRPRPDLVPHGAIVHSASFPSGHSMLAAITYLTIGVLLARVDSRAAIRAYFLTVAVLLTLAIGVSRVYLGVHWPTDVLAGWAIGLLWALLCWAVMRALQMHGTVETPFEVSADLDARPRATAHR